MLGLRSRAILLGVVTVLLVGALAPAVVQAQGPFWYHRASKAEGKGVKLSGQAPEEVRGASGEAVLEGRIAGTPFRVVAPEVQVKGIIYNNALQAQAKLELTYLQPVVKEPAASCGVAMGTNNVVKLFGHMGWKWNGNGTQLEEQNPQNQGMSWLFMGQEMQQGQKGIPVEAPITSIRFFNSGGTCLLAGQYTIVGRLGAEVEPGLNVFGTEQSFEFLTFEAAQHIWTGTRNETYQTNVKLGGVEFKFDQISSIKTHGRQGGAAQEVALFET